jgi:uncharacterized membrane protein
VNSTDNSINVVISESELFTKMKEEITQKVQSDEDRDRILEKVAALEEASDPKTRWERYKDLIAVIGDHMTVLCPFVPALTEWIGKVAR